MFALFSENSAKSKLKSILSTQGKERHALKDYKKSGAATDDVRTARWKWWSTVYLFLYLFLYSVKKCVQPGEYSTPLHPLDLCNLSLMSSNASGHQSCLIVRKVQVIQSAG